MPFLQMENEDGCLADGTARFEYDPNASTGMMLSSQWIEGNGYWDHAVMLYEQMFEHSLDRKLQSWIDRHFGR